jgi:hypothetical protein
LTTFFVPGLGDRGRAAEDTYGSMRKQVEVDLGRPPRSRRILELFSRRGRVDCVTTVGTPDPISGGVVLAIFDMGAHQPFVVWHQRDAEGTPESYDVLECNAYSVVEFEP